MYLNRDETTSRFFVYRKPPARRNTARLSKSSGITAMPGDTFYFHTGIGKIKFNQQIHLLNPTLCVIIPASYLISLGRNH